MYGGVVAEEAEAARLYAEPRHPYTQQLLGSFPDVAHPERALRRNPRHAARDSTPCRPGCPFAPRCPMVFDRCLTIERPPAYRADSGRRVACFLVEPGNERRGSRPMPEPILVSRASVKEFPGQRSLTDMVTRRPART